MRTAASRIASDCQQGVSAAACTSLETVFRGTPRITRDVSELGKNPRNPPMRAKPERDDMVVYINLVEEAFRPPPIAGRRIHNLEDATVFSPKDDKECE